MRFPPSNLNLRVASVRTLGRSFAAGLLLSACTTPDEPAPRGEPTVVPREPGGAPATRISESRSAEDSTGLMPAGLPPAPWTVETGMQRLSEAGAESKLDAWALAAPADGADVARLAALATTVADRVDWTTMKRRPKSPAELDRYVAEMRERAAKLGSVASSGDGAAISTAADRLAQRCADCHLALRD